MGVVPEDGKAAGSTMPSSPCASEDRRMYVGFVSQENDENDDAWLNMARGRACWGRIVPEGSDSPGRI